MSTSPDLARALFRPRGVALIGASDDPGKTPGRPLRFLRRHGFRGAVYPVNPRRETVQGERAWPDLASLPGPVDLAYILLDTEPAIAAVEACAAAGVPVAGVLADGFAEAGAEGEARQRRVVAVARAAGMRLIGPNSMGLVDVRSGLSCTVNAAFAVDDLKPGRLCVLSQSGSLIGTFVSRGQARGIGYASLISLGNEADLTAGEVGAALVEDGGIDAFLLFLETIRRPDEIARFARAAHAAGKPVIAYKLGRSAAGQELAVSHTGALVGSDAASDAFLAALGILRVDQFETLFELPPLVIGRRPPARPRAGRVTVTTTTGGGGAMVVDRLGALGIEVVPPSAETRASLAEKGVRVGEGRLIDVTLAGTRTETMRATIDVLKRAPGTDLLVTVVGSSAQFFPELAVQPIADSDAADRADPERTPLAAFIVPEAPASLAGLAAAGIAAFRTPESCADGIRAFLAWRAPAAPVAATLPAEAAGLIGRHGSGVLGEREALALLATLGVPTVDSTLLDPAELANPPPLAYPVALKVASADVPHKTEAGGVALAVADAAELARAGARILASVRRRHPAARIDGLVAQPMATGLAEVLVGLRRDPQVGPVVTLGAGGVLAELYKDVAVRIAPVDRAGAMEMIERVAGLAPLRGYRGLPKGDLAALADAVAALSRLALSSGVAEAEANPVIVRAEGEGVLAVDGLVRLA